MGTPTPNLGELQKISPIYENILLILSSIYVLCAAPPSQPELSVSCPSGDSLATVGLEIM